MCCKFQTALIWQNYKIVLFLNNNHVAQNWTCLGNLLGEIFGELNTLLVLTLLNMICKKFIVLKINYDKIVKIKKKTERFDV